MNEENPLVSVIVTTYNRKKLLTETLDSILNQTFINFELIVVDNYSDYDFISYMSSFNDSRIRAFQNLNNGIIAVNRNFGIKKAKGKYIAFCDDDDYWKENKLEEQLKHFDDDIIGVGSIPIFIGYLKYSRQKKLKKDIYIDFISLLTGAKPAFSSIVVKNKGILFDEDEKFKFVEDFEYLLKITSVTKMRIKLIAEPFVYYRIHNQNKSSEILNAVNVLNVIEKYKDSIPKKVIKKVFYKRYIALGKKSLKFGDKSATKYFKLAKKNSFGKTKCYSLLLIFISKIPGFIIKKILFVYFKLNKLSI